MIPRLRQVSEQGSDVYHRTDGVETKSSMIGGNAEKMKAIAELTKEQPLAEGDREEYRVGEQGQWHNPATKEGRQSIANDLGLPNIKGGRHKSWEAALDYAARNKPF